MKLKKYNTFLESNNDSNYSIYDFYDELYKASNESQVSKVAIDLIKKWSNIFIGNGYYERVSKFVDDMFETFEGIDLDDIDMRLTDLSDYIDVDVNSMFSIVSRNYAASEFNNVRGLNRTNPLSSKYLFILSITLNILSPTLSMSGLSRLRITPEETYVSDDKFNCYNFNLKELKIWNTIKSSKYASSDTTSLLKYNVDTFFESYKPSIYIRIGDHNKHLIPFNLKEIEEKLDLILPRVFFDVSYEKIIWDLSRYVRRFDDNMNIYDYSIKVILK